MRRASSNWDYQINEFNSAMLKVCIYLIAGARAEVVVVA